MDQITNLNCQNISREHIIGKYKYVLNDYASVAYSVFQFINLGGAEYEPPESIYD
jgi:hypothetical protein